MKYLKLVVIFAWFFGFQHAWDAETSLVRGIIGPFAAKIECERARKELGEMMMQAGTEKAVLGPCIEKKEI